MAGGPLHEREASRLWLEGALKATMGSESGAEPRFGGWRGRLRGVPSGVRVTAVRLAASPAAASVAGGPLHEREASRPGLEGAPEPTMGSEFGAEPRFAAR